ncbi:MAG: TetR/AcrR family transcriptional regulator [Rouxiella badensis]|jgi:AcrR family transcriptional regulator|uniref:TetR family transcriptional regulator n=1 Tax=Rouxiella badensis TaxID=1646377 RepID=A0A1X0WHG8_9GAMM|nr:TetR/AcrR family transcriptional regulator [Rouxiella badensis]MCC3718496.1 TetR/AcrR family transcriptional regulator [Rouxiella badensis]MCC3726736.1 TetR/AcrR family transcriptional regulator [Rouxiella badensis]MCC3738915.1 TetR/AcrR family transcriptional regulator [Rouxiella badensis]ORJ26237.1 TetR family transcriptional regulator [Rouxiella badensis]QII37615.1 TetR/AcrR family transcriptional regulator [Rouxiella badensis]
MAKRRGRPLGFDRSLALQKAMEIFWRKGYEGTQLVDLTSALGINPPSFYAAFGSKLSLFYEAVDLYIATIGSKTIEALNQEDVTRKGLRAMLEGAIANATSSESGGCLMVMGVVNNHAENREAWAFLRNKRVETRELIRARIQRGIAQGDLPANADDQALAAHFLGVTQAISFQARDGASQPELFAMVESALAALPSA